MFLLAIAAYLYWIHLYRFKNDHIYGLKIWSKLSLPFAVCGQIYFTRRLCAHSHTFPRTQMSTKVVEATHTHSGYRTYTVRVRNICEISFWLFLALPIRCTQGRHFENANLNSNENTLFILRAHSARIHKHTLKMATPFKPIERVSGVLAFFFSYFVSFSICSVDRVLVFIAVGTFCLHLRLAEYKIAPRLAMFLAPFRLYLPRMLQQTKWKNVMLLLLLVFFFWANANRKNKNYKTISYETNHAVNYCCIMSYRASKQSDCQTNSHSHTAANVRHMMCLIHGILHKIKHQPK